VQAQINNRNIYNKAQMKLRCQQVQNGCSLLSHRHATMMDGSLIFFSEITVFGECLPKKPPQVSCEPGIFSHAAKNAKDNWQVNWKKARFSENPDTLFHFSPLECC